MIANDTATRAVTQNGTISRRSRASLIALWLTQVALAAVFLMAGGSKLVGAQAMVSLFDALGLGQWFRYVTGVVEVTAGIALLVPLPPFSERCYSFDDAHCSGIQSVPWSVTGSTARAIARRCRGCMDRRNQLQGLFSQ
jgi:hypothetical protein